MSTGAAPSEGLMATQGSSYRRVGIHMVGMWVLAIGRQLNSSPHEPLFMMQWLASPRTSDIRLSKVEFTYPL